MAGPRKDPNEKAAEGEVGIGEGKLKVQNERYMMELCTFFKRNILRPFVYLF